MRTGGSTVMRHPLLLFRRAQAHKDHVCHACADVGHHSLVLLKVTVVGSGNRQPRVCFPQFFRCLLGNARLCAQQIKRFFLLCHLFHQALSKFDAGKLLFEGRSQNFRAINHSDSIWNDQICAVNGTTGLRIFAADLYNLRIRRDHIVRSRLVHQPNPLVHSLFHRKIIKSDAKNVDPKTLVKTKKVTTGKTLTIGAIVSNSVYRDFAIVNDDLAEQIGNKQTMFVMQAFVTDKRGADTAQVKKALKKTIKKYYTIVVFDRDEYKSTMSSMIDQMLMVLYALLALSIIIAIFGIVNTLALSVSERTKEIGLLRAIGTSRGQVRGMLGIEAAIISVFGTVLGLVVGVAAGVVIRAVYASEGLETLAIPWLQLLVFLLLSIVVGLVSSISPASRALKQPVLDAVASE